MPHDRILKYGSAANELETTETIREKLAQSRRLLQQTTDSSTMETLKIYIEELEGRLLLEMSEGPQDQAVGQARK